MLFGEIRLYGFGLTGQDECFLIYLRIGRDLLHKRGGEGKKNRKEDKISVLIVRDRQGNVCDYVLDNLSKEEIQQHLKTIVSPDSILCSDGVEFSSLKSIWKLKRSGLNWHWDAHKVLTPTVNANRALIIQVKNILKQGGYRLRAFIPYLNEGVIAPLWYFSAI